jgi:hypothetical protein
MKITAAAIFTIFVGTISASHSPAKIATPSTIINAKIIPINRRPYFFVLVDNNKIESCVLSPSSDRTIKTKGTNISSITITQYYHNIFRYLKAIGVKNPMDFEPARNTCLMEVLKAESLEFKTNEKY